MQKDSPDLRITPVRPSFRPNARLPSADKLHNFELRARWNGGRSPIGFPDDCFIQFHRNTICFDVQLLQQFANRLVSSDIFSLAINENFD